jgi:hypothetical protein
VSTIGIDLNSFADLRAPGVLAEIGRAFDADPDLRPERIDIRDPLRNKIASAEDYLSGAATLIGSETFYFERRRALQLGGILDAPSYRDPEMAGSPHRLYGGTDDTDEDWLRQAGHLEAFAALFVRLAGAFDATYGFAADDRMPRQQSGEFARARQRKRFAPATPDAHSDRHSVRDVYWLNYFGPAYLERWGKLVDGLGVRSERTSNGGLVIWATESPFVYDEGIESFTAYPWKQPFYEALGRDTFVNAIGASWDQRVPTREDHLRHLRPAAAQRSPLARKAGVPSQSRVVDVAASTATSAAAPPAPPAAPPASPALPPAPPAIAAPSISSPTSVARPAAGPSILVSRKPPAPDWLVEVVGEFRRLGFFANHPTDAFAAAEVAAEYKAKWRRLPEPGGHRDELLLAGLDRTRVWWEDTESVVAPGRNAYATVLEGWSRISRGVFAPAEVREEWQGAEGPIVVHLRLGEVDRTLVMRYLEDSLDMGLLDQVNALLDGTDFRFCMHAAFDQTALVVALDDLERRVLADRGWAFAV